MIESMCFHCGNNCNQTVINFDQKKFCCNGCKTVYDIFSSHNLSSYYDLQSAPGAIPKEIKGKYDYLDTPAIIQRLTEFDNDTIKIVSFYIPHIHCSSCIWILENLHKLQPAIHSSQVNFPKKSVRITFNTEKTTLKEIVVLLNAIGYEPHISLEDYKKTNKKVNRSLIYKIGVAGFAFGNVMFLSFPEYFEVSEFWLDKYKYIFRWLMFFFSLPVVFYSAQAYFISAYKGLQSRLLPIDVPIALGILVLFIRSTTEIIMDWGTGFFDSLTGLVFFLLLGKFFQQKTYSFLSFERDYKSYFPIAVTRIYYNNNTHKREEENIQVYSINKGDRILIRNEELIPVDAILIDGTACIDYSFVTGESDLVMKQSGDTIFAGGKQLYGAIEIEALKSVEQSYLTQLWSHSAFTKKVQKPFVNLTDIISSYFTKVILFIAILSTIFWLWFDASKAMQVFTAVLIIACPCALALSRPFALGNMLRVFGKNKFYLKNADVIEQMAQIDTIIFDKTGTITTKEKGTISYHGIPLTYSEKSLLKTALRPSNHPLSRSLYEILPEQEILTLNKYHEQIGKGIKATIEHNSLKIGSADFVGYSIPSNEMYTSVHIVINNQHKGYYVFHNQYRNGLSKLFLELDNKYELAILSGDNEGEKEHLKQLLPQLKTLLFNQKPDAKLTYIESLQKKGKNVLMVGDGLNDAGALAQSNVGIALSENINTFSPACDAILSALHFQKIEHYLRTSKNTIRIIKSSFIISFIYNIIGLYFAVTGQLSPVIAAILMPLSSISIVVYVTGLTSWLGKKL
ncbi:heavy metal translocating P-type ATPase [Aquimarina pacifica]|uniref:heavy metal translocating P-type ATPase n=1 Tax=Aquimarina pacifica TaxID=1296415 RepID=UPI0004703868|nr:heavy metal translocating P-type ATPase metal-binding domain-containing protein [Aquimarina pacifica]